MRSRSLIPSLFPAFIAALRNWRVFPPLPQQGFPMFSALVLDNGEGTSSCVQRPLRFRCKNILVEDILSFHICRYVFRISQDAFLFILLNFPWL